MATIGSLIRRIIGFSLILMALAAGIGCLVALIGNGWKDFSSKDKLTFLACSAYDHQLYMGFLKVKRPATLEDFADADRPDGSWYFLWQGSNGKWAWRNLGPRLDFDCISCTLGPEPNSELAVALTVNLQEFISGAEISCYPSVLRASQYSGGI